MNRKEFIKLVREAENGSMLPPDVPDGRAFEVLNAHLTPFDGIALHKDRVMANKKSAISFVRYQALQLNGEWDWSELENLSHYFKRVDIV